MSAEVPSPAIDLAVLVGVLSRDPAATELASGSVLHRYEVTVRTDGAVRTVPVSWIDPRRPPKLAQGDVVAVVGAVHRRFFRAGATTRSATEVAATRVARADARGLSAVRSALDEALVVLGPS